MHTPANSIESGGYSDQAATLVRRSGFLFIATSVILVALEGLEASGVLSNPVQGGLSFAVTLFAAAVVIVAGMRLRTPARLHWAIYLLIASGAAFMLISWTEDLPFLDHVPVLGQDDKLYRKMSKIMLLSIWFTSPPFVAWNMIGVHRRMTDRLEDRVADRTKELSEANARLHSEIREHVLTGNELKETQAKLASLVDKRSQQLAVAQQELVRHERLKALGTMASGIAHELNNALVPIKAYVELLMRSDGLTKEQMAWLQNVGQATADAAYVVHSLQQFHGKASSDGPQTLLDPADVVRQVVDLTRPVWKGAAEADGKRITVCDEVEPNLTISANAGEIRQVLTNLILNSVDAIRDEGVIRIEVRSNKDTVEFCVVDDGDGLEPEQSNVCMEPFYTTKPGGTGLGLSVCSGIVQKHGGRLSVDSSAVGETIFRFCLPLEQRSQSIDDNDASDQTEASGQIPLRALYVEDDANVRRAFGAVLTSLGVDVVLADGGKQAISICEDGAEFDLLIVDMGMPDLNGAETIAALNDRGVRCPTVVVSGWSVQSVIDRFGKQPLPDFILPKPVRIKTLEQTLSTVAQSVDAMNAESN